MSSQYYVRSCVCHSSATLSIQRKAARSFGSFLDGTKRNWEQRFHIILERCLLAMYLLPLLSTSPQIPRLNPLHGGSPFFRSSHPFVFPSVFLLLTLSVWSCHSTAMILRLTGLIYQLPFTILLAHIYTRRMEESKACAKRRWLPPIYFNLLFIVYGTRNFFDSEFFHRFFLFSFFPFLFNLEITIFSRDKEKVEKQYKQRRYFGWMKFNWDSLFFFSFSFFFACKFSLNFDGSRPFFMRCFALMRQTVCKDVFFFWFFARNETNGRTIEGNKIYFGNTVLRW